MDGLNQVLLVGALLLAGGVAAGGLSTRFGLPSLLVFLVVGMLAGEDGPGGIVFDNYPLSFAVGNLALAVILFDGGFRTSLSTFRIGLRPAVVLATVGVAITAGAVGAFGAWALGIDWRLGLLLGAVVSSTDAAAVFSLLGSRGLQLNQRVGATLEIESGANDPMAVFLTLTMIGVVQAPADLAVEALAWSFAKQFGIGAAVGVAAGLLCRPAGRWLAQGGGLTALLLLALGVGVFALVNIAGGSGFLAIYLFGLAVASPSDPQHEEVVPSMDSLAWLAQAGMFLLLGLLVTPAELVSIAVPALSIAAFLIVVARPLAVWFCLIPFRFSRLETAFVAWVGLRGAVPIVLALFPLLDGVPQARLVFNVAFTVVLVSLLVQGTTLQLAARLCRVERPPRQRPLAEHRLRAGLRLAEFSVGGGSVAAGHFATQLDLPEGCRVTLACRGPEVLDLEVRTLRAGDIVAVAGPEETIERAGVLFRPRATAATARALAFVLHADARFEEVAATYGLPITARLAELSLGEALETLSGRRLVEGDEVLHGRARFHVQEAPRGRPERIGLAVVSAGHGAYTMAGGDRRPGASP